MDEFSLSYAIPDARRFVKNRKELADSLGCSLRTLAYWKNSFDDFPEAEQNGLYRLERFHTWLDLHRKKGDILAGNNETDDPADDSVSLSSAAKDADLRYREFRAKKMEREFHILEEKYVPKDAVAEAWKEGARKLFLIAISVLGDEFRLFGLDAVSANVRAESAMNEIFKRYGTSTN